MPMKFLTIQLGFKKKIREMDSCLPLAKGTSLKVGPGAFNQLVDQLGVNLALIILEAQKSYKFLSD